MSGRAAALLSHASGLMEAGGPTAPALWARCSALLTRQALEVALDDWWRRHAPAVSAASRHSQLLCLGSYLEDEHLAGEVAHAWVALSHACHYHSYELVPTAGELEAWMESVRRFASLR